MISVIYIWISILIIQLAVATSYRRLYIALTTVEGWNDRLDPIFFAKRIFICIRTSQKKFGRILGVSTPPKKVFFAAPRSKKSFSKIAVHTGLQSLTANNSCSKPLKLEKYHIFGIVRTSAFTWPYPGQVIPVQNFE